MALADPVLPSEALIRVEKMWRHNPSPQSVQAGADKLVVARWIGNEPSNLACDGAASRGCHVVEVNLRATDVTITANGVPVHDGKLSAGSVLLTRAGFPMEARYRGASDLLHLFVPALRFDALLQKVSHVDGPCAFERAEPDPVIARLAHSLLGADDLDGQGATLYVESIACAILARVIGLGKSGTPTVGAKRTGLVKWRQRRVAEFVDANLADPIRLHDLARAAGLSRMHFAAQFRAATGIRPHEFVVRRRIERAQDLLRSSQLSLAQVALGVGFQTQAHFTTVFRDHVHETPGRWRQLHQSR